VGKDIDCIKRPLLLAIDRSETLLDLREHAARAMSNGFDDLEWSLPDRFEYFPSANSQHDAIPIRAVALRCEMMNIPSGVQFVSSQLPVASSEGVTVLNLSIPPLRRGNDGEGFARYQDALNFAYALLRGVRFEAEAAGVNVALEAATGGCFLSPIELRELIDAANSWAVGACVNLISLRPGGVGADWLTTLGRRVHSVRIARTDEVEASALVPALEEVPIDRPIIVDATTAATSVHVV